MPISRRIFALALATALCATQAPAWAADRKAMTPELRTEVASLETLRPAAGDRALFDGRPLLVAFFASW